MGLTDNNEDTLDENFARTEKPLRDNGVTGETQETVPAGIEPFLQQNKDWNSLGEKLSPSFKEKVSAQLSRSVKKKITQKLQDKRIQESLALIDLFNRNNIDYVVLKGLTLQFFNRDRVFFDLDIFVPHTDFEKAKVVLKSFGYSSKGEDEEKYSRNTGFHIEYNKTDTIQVELHYRLTEYSFIDEHVVPLMREKRFMDISGIRVPCLSPELMLLQVFLHYSYNHGFLQYYRKWYEDIETIVLNQEIDWSKFLDFARATGCSELIYKILILLEDFNGKKIAVPATVRQELLKNSSSVRLFFTRSFDNHLYEEYQEIKKITDPEKIAPRKSRLDWKIKHSLFFSLGFKPVFFNSRSQYIEVLVRLMLLMLFRMIHDALSFKHVRGVI